MKPPFACTIAALAALALPLPVCAGAAEPAKAPPAAPEAGAVPAATVPARAAARVDGPRCSGAPAAPARMSLQLGKSTLMRLLEPVQGRSVGNPAVLQAMLVSPETLYLVGVDVGSTNLIVQGRSGACSVIDIVVGMDVSGLQAALAALLPEEKEIRVSAAADALVLSGTVADATVLARVLELAQAFVRRPAKALAQPKGEGAEPAGEAGAGPRIVNMLGVSAPQQVMLEVQIAEVSKTLLDRLEVATSMRRTGEWAAALASNFLSGTAKGSLAILKGSSIVEMAGERQDGLVRILAEPTVMAISGQEGSFLAGGKIFIPVAQDNNRVQLEEKEFGVGLRFTPTVLAGGRIHLKVAPEVSELARDGIGISSGGVSGRAIMPLITTRRATTTVQLHDGQSFAIGGLIRDNQVGNVNALPVLGELPVLGALFRSTDFQRERTELLFIVTPRLVKPLKPGYALPTDALQPPSRAELMLGGMLEATPTPPSSAAPTAAPASAQGPAQVSAHGSAHVSGFQLK
ncbi:type II and III secretion system protein family protein [Pseudoduganella buxea]|uniref:Type II and III secretion system protein family protein n=1 Tax=Pseudoduganella buxea TaxID=1949069 RepID=A0A6I3SXM8_9BURK|nr:type II and III secretion system protein family protein [Pseudoduganella buxea]MTV53012.1 type II and III secretion system protein family protein [Pseudoduganella buxea]GGC08179.1 hypothetical protein GCM10011572_32220 [Pseudoduganella buxea]